MSKKIVLILGTIGFMVFSAILYGVYINVSSSSHLNEMKGVIRAGQTFEVAERRDITPVLKAALTFEPGWKTDIYAKTDGQIERIMVKEGDRVSAGMLVAVIENRELAGQIKQARGNVYSAKASFEQADSEVKRCELLLAQDAVAEVMLASSRYKREMALGQLRSSEGALEQLLVKSEGSSVFASHDGVVLKRYVEEGAFAKVALPLVSIGETRALKVMVPIDGLYREVMSQGAAVGIHINGLAEDQFSGTIKALNASPGLPLGSMLAEITVDNAKQLLQPGAYSQAEISASPVKNALVIPAQAVIIRDGRKLVYRVDSDKHVRLCPVRTGFIEDGWTIVYEGLKEGDIVVVKGQDGLTDGMTVDMGAKSHE